MSIFSHPRYEEVVIHDLRTPLNVISLALRMLDESKMGQDPEAAEDLGMIRANVLELVRMMVHVVDFSRLPASRRELAVDRFDPGRMLGEVIEEVRGRSGEPAITLDLESAPEEVSLDPVRTRMAYQKTLLNVAAAGGGRPVRARLARDGDRFRSIFAVDAPPRDSVTTHAIDTDHFERLLGVPAERRGLDLAIASRISRLFGGSAVLEAIPGQGTQVILDWPIRLDAAS